MVFKGATIHRNFRRRLLSDKMLFMKYATSDFKPTQPRYIIDSQKKKQKNTSEASNARYILTKTIPSFFGREKAFDLTTRYARDLSCPGCSKQLVRRMNKETPRS